jgi:hypothetical protein
MATKRGILLGLVLAFALVRPAPAADAPDIFTVAAVPVDATAANAAAARDAARADGQRRAYQILLDRLTLASDHARLPPASDATLNTVIAGYEVAKERASGVRYLANYTFRFRPDAVRRLLRQAGIPFAEARSKPVVVLAVLGDDAQPMLWEDPNPWREAWTNHPPRSGLVPLVVPYGELGDVQAIDGAAALKGDAAGLQAIAGQYKGADVLVAHATVGAASEPHAVAVTATRYDATGTVPPQSWTKTYAATPGESDADLLADAVAGTAAQVEDAWKTANIINFGQTGTMNVRVPLDDLKAWVTIRELLTGVPAIARSELVSLDRDEARVAIHYYGNPEQVRVALAQRNLALSGNDPDWVLQLGAAPAPH